MMDHSRLSGPEKRWTYNGPELPCRLVFPWAFLTIRRFARPSSWQQSVKRTISGPIKVCVKVLEPVVKVMCYSDSVRGGTLGLLYNIESSSATWSVVLVPDRGSLPDKVRTKVNPRCIGVCNTLSCRGLTSVVRWGGADVWQLTSGWRQDWREFFFVVGVHFFDKKNAKKHFFFWKQGHSEATEAQYMPTVHHWWDTQTKQTRQTYRQSIQTTPWQFTKRWKRIIRPSKDETKEVIIIRVKLNWEEHIWSLFITTVNKYCDTSIYIYIYTHTHIYTVNYSFNILAHYL